MHRTLRLRRRAHWGLPFSASPWLTYRVICPQLTTSDEPLRLPDEYVILDFMKNMFRFCLIASLLSAAIARGTVVVVHSPQNERFGKEGSVVDIAPWHYADNVPVLAGERFRLVAVRGYSMYSPNFGKEKAAILNGTASVTLDALGNPVPRGFGNLEDMEGKIIERKAVLGSLNGTSGKQTSSVVSENVLQGAIGNEGVVFEVNGESISGVARSLWSVTPPENDTSVTDPMLAWWVFLVVEDTRCGEGWVPNASLEASGGCMVAPVLKDVGAAMGGVKQYPLSLSLSQMDPPAEKAYVEARYIVCHEVLLPSRVTIEDNGGDREYTDAGDIERLYTPVLSAFTQVEGGFKLSIAERGEGQYQSRLDGEAVQKGVLYDIVTTTSLKDASWESLDAVLEKKSLAQPAGMRYTRLQLNGLSDVFLPIMDDKTRFYKVQRSTMTQGEK